MLLALILATLMSIPQTDQAALSKKLDSERSIKTVMTELFVTPDGTIQDCTVKYSQSPKSRTDKFCRDAIGLKLVKPASGPDGKPAYGMMSFGWTLVQVVTTSPSPPPTPPKVEWWPADLSLTVAELPKQYGNALRVELTLLVNEQGSAILCEGAEKDPADYVNAACRQVEMLKLQARSNAAGMPVSYVAKMTAEFTAPKK